MKKLIFTIWILVLAVAININKAEGQWNSIGPYGAPIVVSDSYENRLFIATQDYSVFRSLDNGNTWKPVYSVPYPDYYFIPSIEVTEEFVFINIGWGIVRSANNGETWDNIPVPYGAPLNILQSINGILYLGDYGNNLYKSNDNGDNWALTGHLTIPDIGSSFSHITSNSSNIFVSDNNGLIYKGNNNGSNWSVVLDSLEVLNIAKLESNESYLFASAYGKGMLRSSDNGNSWEYANNGLTNLYINSFKYYSSKLYAATGEGVYCTLDNGSNWFRVSNGLPDISINELFTGEGILFAGCSNLGIFKTTDNAMNWFEANNGFTGNTISSIISNNEYLFAGSYYGSVFRSSDNGLNWTSINIGTTNYDVRLLSKDNLIFCAKKGYDNNNMFRSSDLGNNWELINSGLPNYILNLARSGDNILAGTSSGIYFTSNNGENWVPKNNGLPSQRSVNSIYSTGNYLFASVGNIYRSSNNGDNWELKNSGIQGPITDFSDNGNFIFALGLNGMFRSNDNGENWTSQNQGFSGEFPNSIVSSGNLLFASYGYDDYGAYYDSSRFYYSNNNGLSWIQKNDGFNIPRRIQNLYATDEKIFAGLRAESVWEININEIPQSQSVLNDVGVAFISEPLSDTIYYTDCDSNKVFNSTVCIYNYGTNNQHSYFNINFELSLNGSVVFSDIRQDTLSSGMERYINFNQFNINGISTGFYKMKSWTELVTDTSYSNDTAVTILTVLNPNLGGGLASNMGYYFANSTLGASCAPDQPVFQWEDTTGSVSLISNGVAKRPFSEGNLNDGYFILTNILPQGTVFQFDGICFDTFTVSTDGIIGLGSSTSGLIGSNIHNFPESNLFRGSTLFPLWYNLNFGVTSVTGRNLKYKVTSNKIIITYDKVPSSDFAGPNNYVSFQVILETASYSGMENGIITFQYDNTKCGSEFLNRYYNKALHAHIVGIQNNAGDKAVIYRKGENYGTVIIPGPLFGSPLAVSFGSSESVLPIELTSFTFFVNENNANLNWQTSRELNNSGFNVERSVVKDQWINAGFVKGNGNTSSVTDYSFADKNLAPGRYSYRLKQIDFNGSYEYFNLSGEVNIGIPDKYELSQNYPNPFNPVTVIRYSLTENGFTSLKIYDITGREITKLVNEKQDPGRYEVTFNGRDFASGVYFYELRSGKFVSQKRMLLLK